MSRRSTSADARDAPPSDEVQSKSYYNDCAALRSSCGGYFDAQAGVTGPQCLKLTFLARGGETGFKNRLPTYQCGGDSCFRAFGGAFTDPRVDKLYGDRDWGARRR
jgi:hypothetical protein